MILDLQTTHSVLQDYVTRDDVALVYRKGDREYAIYRGSYESRVPRLGFVPFGSRFMQAHTIDFCPITGGVLPGDIGEQWLPVLQADTGLAFDYDWFHLSKEDIAQIPPEFMSEEWWLKRNIGPTSKVLSPDWVKPALLEGVILGLGDPEPAPGHNPPGTMGWFDGPEFPFSLRRFRGRLPHLCEPLEVIFEDSGAMIAYLPWTREYGVRVLNVGEPLDTQPIRIVPIYYCPCCGDKFPDSLRPQWTAELHRHGLSAPSAEIDALPPEGTPPDLASENWWRAQGL